MDQSEVRKLNELKTGDAFVFVVRDDGGQAREGKTRFQKTGEDEVRVLELVNGEMVPVGPYLLTRHTEPVREIGPRELFFGSAFTPASAPAIGG